MKIFLSGLGMNGKTTLINELKEKGIKSFHVDSRGLLEFFKTSNQKLSSVPDLVTEYRLNAYKLMEPWETMVVDRSIFDQIAISSMIPSSNYNIDDYDRICNEFVNYVGISDEFVLFIMSRELIESIYNSNDCDHRNWVYDSVDDYMEKQVHFVDMYKHMMSAYLPENKLRIFNISSWDQMTQIKSYILGRLSE